MRSNRFAGRARSGCWCADGDGWGEGGGDREGRGGEENDGAGDGGTEVQEAALEGWRDGKRRRAERTVAAALGQGSAGEASAGSEELAPAEGHQLVYNLRRQ